MADRQVHIDELDDAERASDHRSSRRNVLIAIVLLLLLLLCIGSSSVMRWTTGGGREARFIARNARCLKCHTELIPDFSRDSVHQPFETRACDSCHTPHGKIVSVTISGRLLYQWRQAMTGIQWLPLRLWIRANPGAVETAGAALPDGGNESKETMIKGVDSKLILPEEDLCWMCHGDLAAKKSDPFQHQPFSSDRCGDCHNPHSSEQRTLLTQAPNQICLTCHPMGPQLTKMQSHPPAKEGWCTECHDPHASKFVGVLVARQRELCFRCHPTVAIKEDMPVQHGPFMNDNCSGCHEPHGSEYMPLLVTEQPKLCYRCHEEISDQFAQDSHHPIGVDLTCASCHDPHAAQYKPLLTAKDNDFCYKCHGEMQEAFEPSKHEQALCIGCHTPHGSAYEPILQAENPDLCLTCHDATVFDEETDMAANNHPVRPKHYDVNARRNLNCSSSCHDPHGTENGKMLRYFSASADGNCLMCHAVGDKSIVGYDF